MAELTPTENPVQQAIRAAGGASAVAAAFEISRVSVHEWIKAARIPPEKAPVVAEMAAKAGRYFPLNQLCPSVPWSLAASHAADVGRDSCVHGSAVCAAAPEST